MALFTVRHASDQLKMNTATTALIPETGRPRAVLFLFHALGEDGESWLYGTDIEPWAAQNGLAVLLPSCHRGMYADMALGHNYFTYVSKEIPALSERWFPLLAGAPRYALGAGIGGWGALRCALQAPDVFAGAAALEPVLDISRPCPGALSCEWADAFGEGKIAPEHDLLSLAEKCAGVPRPRVLLSCERETAAAGALMERLRASGVLCRAAFGPLPSRGEWLRQAARQLTGEGA